MIHLPILATAEQDFAHSHSVMDALPHLGGMLMVLITLLALWGLTVLISKIVVIIRPNTPAAPPAGAQKTTPAAAPAAVAPVSGIAPEIIAVIAAAVATATRNSSVRIVSIKPMSTSWERAGRQSVLTSHRIR
jgi:sodium pump decarboxylase gamma subunit